MSTCMTPFLVLALIAVFDVSSAKRADMSAVLKVIVSANPANTHKSAEKDTRSTHVQRAIADHRQNVQIRKHKLQEEHKLREEVAPPSDTVFLGFSVFLAVVGCCCLMLRPRKLEALPKVEEVEEASESEDLEPAPDYFYVVYFESDSTDPQGTWNPTSIGGSDGVQLAIVKDGSVEELKTTGVCQHSMRCARGQREWYNLLVPVHCVNYTFTKLPTLEEAQGRKEECGTKKLPGWAGWGGTVLTTGEVYSTICSPAILRGSFVPLAAGMGSHADGTRSSPLA